MRLILFDIDGTLLLSGGAGLEALRRVFRSEYGIEDGVDSVPFHGMTDPIILRNIVRGRMDRELEPGELERLTERYLEHLDTILLRRETDFRVLPGARALVEELAARGDVVLGLATGNFEQAAFAKLARAGLGDYFDFGGYGSDSEVRAELTRVAIERGRERAGAEAEVVLVGDTIHDVRSAVTCGVDCLAVATGNASVETLRGEGARWTAPTLEDPAVRAVLGLS